MGRTGSPIGFRDHHFAACSTLRTTSLAGRSCWFGTDCWRTSPRRCVLWSPPAAGARLPTARLRPRTQPDPVIGARCCESTPQAPRSDGCVPSAASALAGCDLRTVGLACFRVSNAFLAISKWVSTPSSWGVQRPSLGASQGGWGQPASEGSQRSSSRRMEPMSVTPASAIVRSSSARMLRTTSSTPTRPATARPYM
jgi:hypothetical protein